MPVSAASIPTIKPEDVGLSSERLQRIHEAVERHIDAHDISGAVTVVSRKGHLAHLEAHVLMDIDSKKAVSKDSLFWIASPNPSRRGRSDAYGRGQDPAQRSCIQIYSGIPRHERGRDAGKTIWGARRTTVVLHDPGHA